MDELSSLRADHVFLRREVLDHGYDDRDLRDAVRAGVLTRVRHGAYVLTKHWPRRRTRSSDTGSARTLSSTRTGCRLVLSHVSAAVEHGLRLNDPDLSKVHVTCLGNPIAKTTPDVSTTGPRARDSQLRLGSAGIVLVDPMRAALETATMTIVANGLVVLDSLVDLGHASVDEVIARWTTVPWAGLEATPGHGPVGSAGAELSR